MVRLNLNPEDTFSRYVIGEKTKKLTVSGNILRKNPECVQ